MNWSPFGGGRGLIAVFHWTVSCVSTAGETRSDLQVKALCLCVHKSRRLVVLWWRDKNPSYARRTTAVGCLRPRGRTNRPFFYVAFTCMLLHKTTHRLPWNWPQICSAAQNLGRWRPFVWRNSAGHAATAMTSQSINEVIERELEWTSSASFSCFWTVGWTELWDVSLFFNNFNIKSNSQQKLYYDCSVLWLYFLFFSYFSSSSHPVFIFWMLALKTDLNSFLGGGVFTSCSII